MKQSIKKRTTKKRVKHRTNRTRITDIRRALRSRWLWSPERNERLKYDNRTCQVCGKKQTTAKGKEHKVTVHHINGIDPVDKLNPNWTKFVNQLFCPIEALKTVCSPKYGDCHKLEHEKMKIEGMGGKRLSEFN